MLEKEKIVEIQDLERKLKFRIKLFGVMEGLDFIDHFAGGISNNKLEIRPYLNDLLPLAVQLGVDGVPTGISLNLETASAIFENPLAVLDLATEILSFQMVFLTSSPKFQPFANRVQLVLDSMTSV